MTDDLGPYLCPKCHACLAPQELDHTMCRACAEKDMARRLGAGLLDLPSDWYDEDIHEGLLPVPGDKGRKWD
jgi:hypothetical protein